MDKKKIGFIVNPYAGMGGPLALKGTDNVEEAIRRGGQPIAEDRGIRAILTLDNTYDIHTCGGQMGQEVLVGAGHQGWVEYIPKAEPTTSDDTIAAVEALKGTVDVIVFVGGDGTARDIYSVIDDTPVLGVPSGVKMYSGVFVTRPERLGEVLEEWYDGITETGPDDVLDADESVIDERIVIRRFGRMNTIVARYVQPSKGGYEYAPSSSEDIAEYIIEEMQEGVVYLLGPGGTLSAVKKGLGIDPTPAGVDAVLNKALYKKDLTEKEILAITDPIHIIISPIGKQGFVLGRGNTQLSGRVIRKAEKDHITVVASREKLRVTPLLRVDTGDKEIDDMIRGFIRVVTGYYSYKMCRVV